MRHPDRDVPDGFLRAAVSGRERTVAAFQPAAPGRRGIALQAKPCRAGSGPASDPVATSRISWSASRLFEPDFRIFAVLRRISIQPHMAQADFAGCRRHVDTGNRNQSGRDLRQSKVFLCRLGLAGVQRPRHALRGNSGSKAGHRRTTCFCLLSTARTRAAVWRKGEAPHRRGKCGRLRCEQPRPTIRLSDVHLQVRCTVRLERRAKPGHSPGPAPGMSSPRKATDRDIRRRIAWSAVSSRCPGDPDNTGSKRH